MTFNELLGDTPSADYCEYFFLRNRGAEGYVITYDPSHGEFLFGANMEAHNRGNQLFKFQAIPNDQQCAMIIHQATQLAVCFEPNGLLILKSPAEGGEYARWAISATDQIQPNASSINALGLSIHSYGFPTLSLGPDTTDPTQQFERLYPSDFVFVRNSWTGRVLTADDNHGVAWQQLGVAGTDYQQWGITSDGLLVNRATAEVLQLSDVNPVAGLQLNTGPQLPADNNAQQQFDVISNGDGSFRSTGGYALAIGANDSVVTAIYSATDYTQLLEPISPFQFFSLVNGVNGGNEEWLARNGSSAVIAGPGAGVDHLFTVSRYGEIISPIDGFVLQSQGIGQPPAFVDPAPDPIGFDSTTFQCISGLDTDWDQIALRSNTHLSLLSAGLHSGSQPWIYWAQPPVSGCQAWQMIGPAGGLFAAYQEVARMFFLNPAPLPGQPAPFFIEANPELEALVGDNQKTALVIFTIVAGILDVAAGISVGSVGTSAVEKLAQLVLGSQELAAKIAVVMQGTITAASVIAIADGITKAGLWWKIFRLLLPNSFWGWALTIAKLGLTIAAWAVGVGPAITGAKIALVVASVINILNSDEALVAEEAQRLEIHVDRLRITSRNRLKAAA